MKQENNRDELERLKEFPMHKLNPTTKEQIKRSIVLERQKHDSQKRKNDRLGMMMKPLLGVLAVTAFVIGLNNLDYDSGRAGDSASQDSPPNVAPLPSQDAKDNGKAVKEETYRLSGTFEFTRVPADSGETFMSGGKEVGGIRKISHQEFKKGLSSQALFESEEVDFLPYRTKRTLEHVKSMNAIQTIHYYIKSVEEPDSYYEVFFHTPYFNEMSAREVVERFMLVSLPEGLQEGRKFSYLKDLALTLVQSGGINILDIKELGVAGLNGANKAAVLDTSIGEVTVVYYPEKRADSINVKKLKSTIEFPYRYRVQGIEEPVESGVPIYFSFGRDYYLIMVKDRELDQLISYLFKKDNTEIEEKEWQESKYFTTPDGSKVMGIENKIGLRSPVVNAGKVEKFAWLFWGDINEGDVKVTATHKGTGEVKQALVNGGGPLKGPLMGADAHFPCNMSFPYPGLWRLDVYVGGVQHGYVVMDVKE
ncbi:hypothetical protein [Pseudalkalibacillus caeni]|uniref:DUF4871 domain-containing protein n=1 Tax=Exobacillus caeni TaxID=2574798 RepID=A0A5R9FBD9_9BACL|nr:hypothetical protein [Pseudalkalibacillus caeni]TLS38203.1 hypothetical protein FCL54_06605 [Pseudalkalibacillus caeni]